MPTWQLVVVADQEYRIPVGQDESVALQALADARNYISKNGTVTIANRLALEAKRIISVRIEERAGATASF
jgi:hypothetical protein